jgi:hypothetical protein
VACGAGCPEEQPSCLFYCVKAKTPGDFGFCGQAYDGASMIWGKPLDGRILATQDDAIDVTTVGLDELTFEGGLFLFQHGQGDRVAYADRGLFTGEPLPLPTTCPELTAGQACGGLCGGCPVGQVCTGRSPLHPHGVCVTTASAGCRYPKEQGWTCQPTEACFAFTVEPERQAFANRTAFCVPKAVCEEYRKLPGGGECY